MNDTMILELARQAFWAALLSGGPVLGLILLIGVAVSLLQAVTQIQEATLTFAPKLLGAGLLILVGGYWMFEHILRLAEQLFSQLGQYAH